MSILLSNSFIHFNEMQQHPNCILCLLKPFSKHSYGLSVYTTKCRRVSDKNFATSKFSFKLSFFFVSHLLISVFNVIRLIGKVKTIALAEISTLGVNLLYLTFGFDVTVLPIILVTYSKKYCCYLENLECLFDGGVKNNLKLTIKRSSYRKLAKRCLIYGYLLKFIICTLFTVAILDLLACQNLRFEVIDFLLAYYFVFLMLAQCKLHVEIVHEMYVNVFNNFRRSLQVRRNSFEKLGKFVHDLRKDTAACQRFVIMLKTVCKLYMCYISFGANFVLSIVPFTIVIYGNLLINLVINYKNGLLPVLLNDGIVVIFPSFTFPIWIGAFLAAENLKLPVRLFYDLMRTI